MIKNQKNFSKILAALSLSTSDAREDTLTSVILNTIYEKGNLTKDKLSEAIVEIYGFEPYKSELNSIVDTLVSNERILNSDNVFSLSEKELASYHQLDLEIKDSERNRFNNFSQFIISQIDDSANQKDIKLLWQVFRSYLYNSFFEFGEDALSKFNPYVKSSSEINSEDILNDALNDLKDHKQKKVFKLLIDKFPDYASEQDLNFLNDLAQKTISFASLGFEPKLFEQASDKEVISWILFLDTNVLYSLLNLHSHPESAACKELIKLINENSKFIDIKLRYSSITHRELLKKRGEFKHLSENISTSAIKGILKSESIDAFSRQYYEGLLFKKESTIHPSQVIDLSQDILRKSSIEVSRDDKRIEQLGDKYLGIKVQEYLNFISTRNESRKEAYEKKGISEDKQVYKFKSDQQATHDITLRELISQKRFETLKDAEHITFNSVKYYVITLDDILIKHDSRELIGKIDDRAFPIFFKPSFLLNRLIKLLPIKTNDYKRAFIKALTSRGFNKDIKKSHDIIRLVNYLRDLGIDNEDLVYSVISKDLFIHKFREYDDETQSKEFVESELNKIFTETLTELSTAKEKLQSTLAEKDKIANQTVEIQQEKQQIEQKKGAVEGELKVYKDAIGKLKKRVDTLEKERTEKPPFVQGNINFSFESLQKENRELKDEILSQNQIRIEEYKSRKVKKWKRLSSYFLALTIIASILLFYFLREFDWVKILLTILFNGLSLPIFILRHFNESNIKTFKDRITIPKEVVENNH